MTLDELEAIIATRAKASPEDSWTAKLLAQGRDKVAEKLGEEAIETVIEAVKGNKAGLTSEAADLLFHLLVVLYANEVSISDVMAELERRQSRSGIAEKASRQN
ncbi:MULTISPECIES: phosphoribosyl-ATP diphosphatase [Lentibacter]|jgi:phosphoribosyl-ATP pyrophosphohydrolase|uniref:Phosphoribosyl-ATP pyrophosphatase n=2 Tax=Lentibacter algarum TaxID=576131 RepID=A0A1H3I459_9RHOB|nr:phosphoribosyl-ATP diphosphatase [Lentibacter algarum]MCH9823970.1 phosphoribosyl-ATP diphosphatase [Alphaproteobacteria bacterium]MCO4827530.1 phosphoribosyl-ATP diphosphatase [Lentibacter algarum]WIF31297.1 phosphoribosyl-ATP pyrophosphatase HisE [Lentibacter algarum]SDY22496.1 phosphoribosyl-ATP pyrophosphatase [Lentibacter algarum]